MGSTPYKFGEQIVMKLQEPGGDATKIIKATLTRDDTDAVIAGPITLTHITDGLYKDISLNMTAIEKQTIQMEIFDSDGVTPNTTGDQFFSQSIDLADEDQGTSIVQAAEIFSVAADADDTEVFVDQDESAIIQVEEDLEDVEVFAEEENDVIVIVEPDPEIIVFVEE